MVEFKQDEERGRLVILNEVDFGIGIMILGAFNFVAPLVISLALLFGGLGIAGMPTIKKRMQAREKEQAEKKIEKLNSQMKYYEGLMKKK